MTLTPGARLGPYEIVAHSGAGGMGDVYRARDVRLDREVAIKTIKGPFTERFEREARAISALNHPNICTLYDVGDHEGHGYLVMEYVDGKPIAGPLPPDQASTLLHATTGETPLLPHEIEALAERSGGNPLLLGELLAAARQAGGIEGLPDSIESLMTAQIDRLTPTDRRLLRSAAVIGIGFTAEALAEAVGEMLDEATANLGLGPHLRIVAFDGLLIDLVARERADCIVRGIRAVSDFEYEFQMALMNRKLRSTVETVFLMPHEKYTYISSRLIKEVASFGTSVAGMVPPVVEKRLTEKFPPR